MAVDTLGRISKFHPLAGIESMPYLFRDADHYFNVWNGTAFEPQLTLPFSLSYDHRVIDGAEAARFCRFLADVIEDLRRALV